MRWDPPPRNIRPKEGDVRLWSNMGYPCGQNSVNGTARGNCALLPESASRFVGACEVRAVGR